MTDGREGVRGRLPLSSPQLCDRARPLRGGWDQVVNLFEDSETLFQNLGFVGLLAVVRLPDAGAEIEAGEPRRE